MPRGKLSGEDKVIVACVAMLTVLTIAAIIALVVSPSQTNTIVPVMAGTVIAISTLAARHPPAAQTGESPAAAAIATQPAQLPEESA